MLLNPWRVPFPLDSTKIHFEVIDGKTYLRFPLQRAEEIYGFGLNFQTQNQRGAS